MERSITKEERDRRVLDLYEQVLELEQRLIPTRLHVFGRASDSREVGDLLRMVASFDRPELGVRSLTNLIAESLGLRDYSTLLAESSQSEQKMAHRERVEAILQDAIQLFVTSADVTGADAASRFLNERAGVPVEESLKVFALLSEIQSQLRNSRELEGLLLALRGDYVEPGPGADIVQNPSILPTGRNTHAVNPYVIPSPAAVRRAEIPARALLDRCLKESNHYPESVAMVLWGIDNIKTEGEAVAQALWLLGVKPLRDSLNRATDVQHNSAGKTGAASDRYCNDRFRDFSRSVRLDDGAA